MKGHRLERIGDQILQCLAMALRELSDPRLVGVSLTGVKMSPDLKLARVYWSSYGSLLAAPGSGASAPAGADTSPLSENHPKVKEIQKALMKAAGVLKYAIADQLELRYVPELHFHFDSSIATGQRIEELLEGIRHR